MHNKRISLLVVVPALLLVLFATPAVAQEIDGFWPGCGAPGDKVLIRGSDFADDPAVSIGGTSAEVLRSRDDAIVCLVPDVVAGSAILVSSLVFSLVRPITRVCRKARKAMHSANVRRGSVFMGPRRGQSGERGSVLHSSL